MGWSGAARDQGTFCFSCHTAVPYALARPSLRTALAEAAPTAAEHQLMEDVRQRVRLWSATRPFYTDQRNGPGKSAQSRGTEAVLSALMLAWDDERSARLSAETRAALEHMWAVQLSSGPDSGAWAWLDFDLAPWEVPDAQYYGAALAALAVGVAPQDYRSLPQIQDHLQLLREYLAAHEDVEVVAECANGFDAVKVIGERSPDMVFLDIQMPKLSGFEVLELLEPGPAVVFCTAYDEYALKAFDVHAVDYLLKPFGRERLAEALARVRSRRAEARAAAATPAPLPDARTLAAAARPPGRWAERVLVKDGARVSVIPVEKVDYLEAQDDYVAIHSEGRSWLKNETLAELANDLDPARFVRIHRSFVLNLERLARLELYAKDSRVAILHDGKQLPVSRAGYARLKELM